MSLDRNEKHHVRYSSAPSASIPSESLPSFLTKNDLNMDPDFQLKVHFNAGGVQPVQKRFLDRSFLTKAKLMTDFPKEVSYRRVSQHESHDNFFRPCDQIFLKLRDKNLAAAKSNSQRPFYHSSDFDSNS